MRCAGEPEVAEAKAELNRVAAQVIERAQGAGALRHDIAPDDVSALVSAAIRGAWSSPDPELWRRYVQVVLDGLRPPTISGPPAR